MVYTSFQQLINAIQERKKLKRVIVIAAEHKHALEAVAMAYVEGLIDPVLVGNPEKIQQYLTELGLDDAGFEIVEAENPEHAAQIAVDMVNAGKGDVLMKGLIDTEKLMEMLLKKENNLRMGGIVSSVCFAEIETYHKLIALTDAAINTFPNIEQKKQIIENAVGVMLKMGWTCPKVAVLSAIEKVTRKMPDTLEAAELKRMNETGEIKNCIVEGPISFDLATDKESAAIKGFDSPIAGDADVLLYPDITSANIGTKTIIGTGHNITGSIIVGLKIPVVMSSRGSQIATKYRGILLAASVN